jgi:hypothetical protein
VKKEQDCVIFIHEAATRISIGHDYMSLLDVSGSSHGLIKRFLFEKMCLPNEIYHISLSSSVMVSCFDLLISK